MDNHTATEQAFKNGYLKGYDKGLEDALDVTIVRCKDCWYWKHVGEGYGDCTHPRFHLEGQPDPTMNMNNFCSCGERKDDD